MEPTTTPQSIPANLGEFYLDSDGIFHIKANESLITLELLETDANAIHNYLSSLNYKPAVVYDVTRITPIERKIRKRFEELLEEHFSSLAVVSNSRIGLAVANIFFALAKTPVPMRIFRSKEDAINWSGNFYQNAQKVAC